MDLSQITSFNVLEKSIKHSAAKQSVISDNIANVNTPNYKRNDLKPLSFDDELKNSTSKLNLATTNSQHINPSTSEFDAMRYSTGNEVELDMEAIIMMQNSTKFAAANSAYKKMLSLVKEAIGSSNR